MPAQWQAKSGPGVWLQSPAVPEAVSKYWWVKPFSDTAAVGLACLTACVGLLMSWAGSQGSRQPRYLRAGVGLLVGGLGPAMAAVVLRLLSTRWWVRLVLRLEQAHW